MPLPLERREGVTRVFNISSMKLAQAHQLNGSRRDHRSAAVVLSPERVLRWSLGLVYLWFGGLKLVNMSPVLDLVRGAYPPLAAVPLYCALTLFEVVVGGLLLAGVWTRWVAAGIVFHLLGTFSVLVTAPRLAFLPYFPFLTVEGEFVVKNLVLLAAAIALWTGFDGRPASPARLPRWAWAALAAGAVGLGLGTSWLHDASREAAERSEAAAPRVRMTAAEILSVVGEDGPPPMVVAGVVTDRCRLVGCWLKVRDHTGELFVDLAPAGLLARGIEVGSPVKVEGYIGKTREGELGFVAREIQPLSQRAAGEGESVPG